MKKLSDLNVAVVNNSSVTEHDYEVAFLIREVEAAFLRLFSEGKINGTVHTCIGQEFSGVAVARQLIPGDHICSNHRGHGHFLAWTGDTAGLIAEIMGRMSGVAGGTGGSQHLISKGFLSNGIQGGMMPIAAGLAWARKLNHTNNVSVVFIGDGTLGEGLVYETFNIASKHQLPLLIVLENNFYAQSTHQRQTLSGDIQARAYAFGIPTSHADTWNVSHLFASAADAVARVRVNGGPFLFQIDTYRLMAHSKGDDNRDTEEIRSFGDKDPLNILEIEDPSLATAMKARAKNIVEAALKEAEAADFPGLTVALPEIQTDTPVIWMPLSTTPSERVANRLYEGLRSSMRKNARIILLGEDIEGPYGGAFKVTKDISQEFPGRALNMPISEAALVGVGCGLALAGEVAVCEIMFGDFILLAADQLINHAAKFSELYGSKARVPLVVRTPMGGRRGYGPTHSQSLEKHFLGVPGLTVLAVNHRYDPACLLDDVFSHMEGPVLFLENKILYTVYTASDAPIGYQVDQQPCPYPTIRMRPVVAPAVTILCYGAMLLEAEVAALQLFEEEDIAAEILCPAQIYPLDLTPILASVRETGRLVVAEEGCGFAAFGSEVIASLAERISPDRFRVARVAPEARSVPASRVAELAHLPDADDIVAAVKRIF